MAAPIRLDYAEDESALNFGAQRTISLGMIPEAGNLLVLTIGAKSLLGEDLAINADTFVSPGWQIAVPRHSVDESGANTSIFVAYKISQGTPDQDVTLENGGGDWDHYCAVFAEYAGIA